MKPSRDRVEAIANDQNRCGEAPIWDVKRQCLIWTDIEGGLIYEWHPATGERSVLKPGVTVSGIALNRARGMILAGAAGLHLCQSQGPPRTLVAEHEGTPLSFNDIIADPWGRIYAGTIYWGPNGMERYGALYLIDTSCKSHIVDDGIELSNGLGFSPDNRILYFADSAARSIYAYDVNPESGKLTRKRAFARVAAAEGIPDGLTVDKDGFIWVALWYGSQVVRYDPEGTVERCVRLPVPQVSSIAFGGRELTDLFITTAAEPWRSHLAPRGYDFSAAQGGALYRLRSKVQGKLEYTANFQAADGPTTGRPPGQSC